MKCTFVISAMTNTAFTKQLVMINRCFYFNIWHLVHPGEDLSVTDPRAQVIQSGNSIHLTGLSDGPSPNPILRNDGDYSVINYGEVASRPAFVFWRYHFYFASVGEERLSSETVFVLAKIRSQRGSAWRLESGRLKPNIRLSILRYLKGNYYDEEPENPDPVPSDSSIKVFSPDLSDSTSFLLRAALI